MQHYKKHCQGDIDDMAGLDSPEPKVAAVAPATAPPARSLTLPKAALALAVVAAVGAYVISVGVNTLQ